MRSWTPEHQQSDLHPGKCAETLAHRTFPHALSMDLTLHRGYAKVKTDSGDCVREEQGARRSSRVSCGYRCVSEVSEQSPQHCGFPNVMVAEEGEELL